MSEPAADKSKAALAHVGKRLRDIAEHMHACADVYVVCEHCAERMRKDATYLETCADFFDARARAQ